MRAKLNRRSITPKIMKVDKVILTWPLSRGVNELSLDELTFGPLVRMDEPEVTTTSHEQESEAPTNRRCNSAWIAWRWKGSRSFRGSCSYHEEPLKDLAEAGFNVVWVPDYADRALLTSVRREGLWAAATPPVPVGSERRRIAVARGRFDAVFQRDAADRLLDAGDADFPADADAVAQLGGSDSGGGSKIPSAVWRRISAAKNACFPANSTCWASAGTPSAVP